MTYSFDVFDTCLSRICGNPEYIFDILARKVIHGKVESLYADFAYIRKSGAIEASKLLNKGEINLVDIYDHCDFSPVSDIDKFIIMQMELEIERNFLRPISKTLKKIDQLHEKGVSVIFISDMYLPSDLIEEALVENGFFKEGDKLYVSCVVGKRKTTGQLYRHIYEENKIKKFNWVHTGDSLWADILPPMKKGIWVSKCNFKYSFYQNVLRNANFNTTFDYVGIIAGIARSICLEETNESRIKFAADLIAPLFVPYVSWVLADAKSKGINNLYFLARDGYIFYKIANRFQKQYPDIGLHYIYASRKSLYLPSMEIIDEDALTYLLGKDPKEKIEEVLDNLQIDISNDALAQLKNSNNIVADILNNVELMEKIEKRRQSQRQLCLEYFDQCRLATHEKKNAIVDLRGTRKCQKSINQILLSGGYKPVFAYYLEVHHNRIEPCVDYPYEAASYGDRYSLNINYLPLLEGFPILEHYFCITSDYRTSSYEKQENLVVPVLDYSKKRNGVDEIVNTNIQVCEKFADCYIECYCQSYSLELVSIALRTFAMFVLNPNRYYLKSLLNIDTSETKFVTRPLVNYLLPSVIINKNVDWVDGSVMLTFGKVIHNIYIRYFKRCIRVIRNLI